MKVTAVMSRPVITVLANAGIKDAARLLIEHSISALPVVDSKGALVGIVSEADLMPMEARPDPLSQATPIPPTAGTTPHTVSDVMTRSVVTVPSTAEVSQAARVMIEADVKRVPVMRGEQLVGIVSRRDLVRVIARRDQDVQAQLERQLQEAGLALGRSDVNVAAGVATIAALDEDQIRRLAESVALTVPGVLEVRFVI
jgi:CBS domain-containing protein